MSAAASRGNWGSRAGFILAAAGSAIGLGNIWGFPTQVGQGGGAAGGTPDAIGRFLSTFVANPSATLALTLLVLLDRMPGAGLWGALIKYVCPVGIAIIIVFTVRAVVGV